MSGGTDRALIIDSAERIIRAPARRGLSAELGAGFIVLTLLLFWVHLDPFHDLTSVSNITASDGGSKATQIVFSALGIVGFAVLLQRGLHHLRVLLTRPLILTGLWLGVSILFSVQPGLSFRRAILLGITIMLSVAVMMAAKTPRQFANLLAGTALALVVVCFVSLLVVPDLSMHTTLDLREPEHAGSWRGFMSHKNEAGSVMVTFVLIGLFAIGAGSRRLGAALVLLSFIFLLGTNSKTALALLPMVLVLTTMTRIFTHRAIRATMLLAPIAISLVLSVGTLYIPAAKSLLASLMSDVSFTGRTDIWTFAFEHIQRRPFTGWGYGAFWKTDATLYGSEAESWVNQADQAHNGYVEIVLVMGWPGLVFFLLLAIWQPLRDFQKTTATGVVDPTTMLFLRLWLFTLMLGVTESVFLDGNNSQFFFFMMSIFGLRLLVAHGLAGEVRGPAGRGAGAPPPS